MDPGPGQPGLTSRSGGLRADSSLPGSPALRKAGAGQVQGSGAEKKVLLKPARKSRGLPGQPDQQAKTKPPLRSVLGLWNRERAEGGPRPLARWVSHTSASGREWGGPAGTPLCAEKTLGRAPFRA